MLRVFGMDLGKKINGIRDIVGGTMGVLRGALWGYYEMFRTDISGHGDAK